MQCEDHSIAQWVSGRPLKNSVPNISTSHCSYISILPPEIFNTYWALSKPLFVCLFHEVYFCLVNAILKSSGFFFRCRNFIYHSELHISYDYLATRLRFCRWDDFTFYRRNIAKSSIYFNRQFFFFNEFTVR